MRTLSLAGPWDLKLDPEREARIDDAFDDAVDGRVFLPGTTDE